ncbi:hypothetical protein HOLleu_12279 [Holothuria leucospilota]|uniref:Uncharacterized protein n=1 Tax=Holothuria leucospilota TaxID=206669 RepID=A0A9Q1HA04_HOLLE|nr:hypothetical protein HOLleu_12279 [Holothuria leucospilota]
MEGCPSGWRYEVVRYHASGLPAAQVCRNMNGSRHWTCSKGWEPLPEDPYCVKVSKIGDANVSLSVLRDKFAVLRAQTIPNCLVADKFKLLFYQLPGTPVEVSPSVFRIRHENEQFHQNPEQYQKFTFVSHPCSRLINFWEEISNSTVNVSFTSFLNDGLPPKKPLILSDGIRLKTQTEMLFDNDGYFRLDQYLVLESWNESLSKLIKGANFGPKILQLLDMKVSNIRKCSQMYTLETWLKMTDSYAIDFCVFQYSTNINDAKIIPPLNFTAKTLAARYKLCRQRTTHVQDSVVMQHSHFPFVPFENPCTIYTYYQPAYDDLVTTITNRNVLRVWERAWASAGWQTRVLDESDAMSHPDYTSLKRKFQSLPTVNSKRYELACFLRYLAMAVVGGGWMSDYDMLPLHFPPCSKVPFNGSFTLWSAYIPCLVSASGNDYTRIAHLMADVALQWRWHTNLFVDEITGFPQVSDMKVFSLLVDQDRVNSFEVIIETRDLARAGFACNKSARLLETNNSGNLPKWMPRIPWGVHISHYFMDCIKNRNMTLWPGLSWETKLLPTFRQKLMDYVHKIYLQKCNLALKI